MLKLRFFCDDGGLADLIAVVLSIYVSATEDTFACIEAASEPIGVFISDFAVFAYILRLR